jgi:hypothetical protein
MHCPPRLPSLHTYFVLGIQSGKVVGTFHNVYRIWDRLRNMLRSDVAFDSIQLQLCVVHELSGVEGWVGT